MRQLVSKMFAYLAIPGRFIENFPLILIACLLIILGTSGAWVSLPLTGELRLKELQDVAINKQTSLFLLFMMALYCLMTFLKLHIARVIIAVAMLCFISYLALVFSFFNGEFVWQYIQESQSFREIQHILALQAIPNSGRSVETILAFDSFHFVDRVKVTLGLMAWGPKLAVLSASLLFLYALIRSKQVVMASLLCTVLFSVFIVVSGVGSVALAYVKLNQGIREINQSNNVEALKQLNEAALIDPVLNYSMGFPLLTSYVYFNIFGPEHKNALAYQINQSYSAGEFTNIFALDSLAKQREQKADVAQNFFIQSQTNVTAILRVKKAIVADAYNRVGFLLFWHQEWSQAEEHFLLASLLSQSAVSKVALLNIYAKTKQYKLCNLMADELLTFVQNRSMTADIWTTKGDCLSADGNELEARLAYQKSIELDADKNYRAVKGLSGT